MNEYSLAIENIEKKYVVQGRFDAGTLQLTCLFAAPAPWCYLLDKDKFK